MSSLGDVPSGEFTGGNDPRRKLAEGRSSPDLPESRQSTNAEGSRECSSGTDSQGGRNFQPLRKSWSLPAYAEEVNLGVSIGGKKHFSRAVDSSKATNQMRQEFLEQAIQTDDTGAIHVEDFAGMLRKPVRQSWWVTNEAAEGCQRCKKRFEMLFRRRHHCRFCGALVCHACSTAKVVFKTGEASLRTCDRCLRKIVGRIDAVFDRRYMRAAISVKSSTPPKHEDGFLQAKPWKPDIWHPTDGVNGNGGTGGGDDDDGSGNAIDEGEEGVEDDESVVSIISKRLMRAASYDNEEAPGEDSMNGRPSIDGPLSSDLPDRPTSPSKLLLAPLADPIAAAVAADGASDGLTSSVSSSSSSSEGGFFNWALAVFGGVEWSPRPKPDDPPLAPPVGTGAGGAAAETADQSGSSSTPFSTTARAPSPPAAPPSTVVEPVVVISAGATDPGPSTLDRLTSPTQRLFAVDQSDSFLRRSLSAPPTAGALGSPLSGAIGLAVSHRPHPSQHGSPRPSYGGLGLGFTSLRESVGGGAADDDAELFTPRLSESVHSSACGGGVGRGSQASGLAQGLAEAGVVPFPHPPHEQQQQSSSWIDIP